ncbi:succinate dehydrogenase cytochrome b560 subunit, mitochondrial [Aethina tumida]|uniref:succinate dehydrogenase cytochrome b560 subunit, mitochondrial n=1 Tax=Aethina tumida TaxID=116153 RepID=UPI002148624C|nr:succinate dehydrogenase cytochrome b560 subunit, mitochondrial [Aethina tumida]
MSLIFRLAGRQTCSQFLKNERTGLLNIVRPVTLQSKTVEACKSEGHDERNMRLNRPQSPHLTIYAPQLTSMLSISHRGTGMVLGSYLIGLGLAGLACPDQIPAWIDALQSFPAPVLLGVKFCLSFPMAYHFWNGIRHLMWDMGKCLTLKGVYTTGYAMLAITFATSIALTML